MSTFDGRIKEYPELAIDNFTPNNYSQFFLLSHVHKDHTRGLENEAFRKTLYCSEQTARMLPLMETRASRQLMYAHLKDRLKAIPYYVPTRVTVKSEEIQFTFYPANHCPGASLILIEGDRGTVLYTGDMRAEPEFVENNLRTLRDFRIKNLYMDTTCCFDKKRTFISKEKSIKVLVDLVKGYPEKYHMYLDTWTPGYEEMWFAIKEEFNSKIHVSEQRYNMYLSLDEKYEDVLTTDATSTRFHSCRWGEKCHKHDPQMVSIHPVPNRNNKAFQYKPTKYFKLLQSDLPRHCKPHQQMILPFSSHSSLTEIVYFYKFIRPKKFTPCVAHGGWRTQYQMHSLLREEGCIVSDTPSSSEIERGNATTSCSSNDAPEDYRSMDDNEDTTCETINYVSTAEESLKKSAASAATANNTVLSHPLSEKSANENRSISSSVPTKTPPSISKDKTAKTHHLSRSKLGSSYSTIILRENEQENENTKPDSPSPSSLPTNLSQQRSKISLKNSLVFSHSSVISSSITTSSLKRTQSREDTSCSVNQLNEVTNSIDPNVIVLSVPSTVDHTILFTSSVSQTTVIQRKQALVESNSDGKNSSGGSSLTSISTRGFINSFVAMRKRRRKNTGKSINDPIIL